MMLLDMSLEELKVFVKEMGEPAFRAKQIYSWLNAGTRFENMTNLSAALREKLRKDHTEGFPVLVTVKTS